jgi:hypothetical protein
MQRPQPEQVVRVSTPPPNPNMSRSPQGVSLAASRPASPQGQVPPAPQHWNSQPSVAYGSFNQVSLSAESLAATSQAAEHWRNSWRDRQRAEAGPAVGVSRGQAVVPEPLMAMQHSLVRMRSLIAPKGMPKEGNKYVYWFSTGLLLCLILGLGIYIAITFIPTPREKPSATSAQLLPYLMPQEKQTTSVTAGKTLKIHGENFGPDTTVTFTLDSNALDVTARTNKKGAFNVDIPTPTSLLVGSYGLQAETKSTKQSAYITIQILPQSKQFSNSTPLQVLDTDNKEIVKLAPKVMTGKNGEILFTLKNSSNAAKVGWSADIVTAGGLNWLSFASDNGGELNVLGTQTVKLALSTVGMPVSTKPYEGYVVIMVDKDQLILPVSLTVQSKAIQVVVGPNPLNLTLAGGGTCLKEGASLTIINLSDQIITVDLNLDGNAQAHLKLNGQPSAHTQLQPAGNPDDTLVVDVTCGNVQAGQMYNANVYANGVPQQVIFAIRN